MTVYNTVIILLLWLWQTQSISPVDDYHPELSAAAAVSCSSSSVQLIHTGAVTAANTSNLRASRISISGSKYLPLTHSLTHTHTHTHTHSLTHSLSHWLFTDSLSVCLSVCLSVWVCQLCPLLLLMLQCLNCPGEWWGVLWGLNRTVYPKEFSLCYPRFEVNSPVQGTHPIYYLHAAQDSCDKERGWCSKMIDDLLSSEHNKFCFLYTTVKCVLSLLKPSVMFWQLNLCDAGCDTVHVLQRTAHSTLSWWPSSKGTEWVIPTIVMSWEWLDPDECYVDPT